MHLNNTLTPLFVDVLGVVIHAPVDLIVLLARSLGLDLVSALSYSPEKEKVLQGYIVCILIISPPPLCLDSIFFPD